MPGGESQRIAFGYHSQILKRCVLERCGFHIKKKKEREGREKDSNRQKKIESDRDREKKETEK